MEYSTVHHSTNNRKYDVNYSRSAIFVVHWLWLSLCLTSDYRSRCWLPAPLPHYSLPLNPQEISYRQSADMTWHSYLNNFLIFAAHRTQFPVAPSLKEVLSKWSGELNVKNDSSANEYYMEKTHGNTAYISASMAIRMWPSLSSFNSEHFTGKLNVFTL